MSVQLVFVILAIVFFCLDGFQVKHPTVSWTPFAFACLTIAVFIVK